MTVLDSILSFELQDARYRSPHPILLDKLFIVDSLGVAGFAEVRRNICLRARQRVRFLIVLPRSQRKPTPTVSRQSTHGLRYELTCEPFCADSAWDRCVLPQS